MVDISRAGDGFKYWNLTSTAGRGVVGNVTDVKLIQYLMVIGCESFGFSFPITEVDGRWGDRSQRAWEAIESRPAQLTTITHDRLFERFPPGAHAGLTSTGRFYKIVRLQLAYWQIIGKRDPDPTRGEAIRLNLPDDGRCPETLAVPLRIIRGPRP